MTNTDSTQTAVYTALRDYVVQEFGSKHPEIEIKADTALIQNGMVDSLGLFILVTFIEDNFGLTIPAELIVLENFASLDAMTQMVERLIQK